MKAVGLTGNIGTGKSTVAQMFESLGAIIIDADAIARTYLTKGMKGYEEVIKRYGRKILDQNLEINRQAVAEIVFKDENERKWLEQLVHPYVFQRIHEEISKRNNKKGIIIVDVPLLFETGANSWLHPTIVVFCDKAIQIKRIQDRSPNLSTKHILNRLNAQIPMEKKVTMADFVIDNSFSIKHTQQQVKRIWNELRHVYS